MPDFIRRFGEQASDGTYFLSSSRSSIITSLLSAGYGSASILFDSVTYLETEPLCTLLSQNMRHDIHFLIVVPWLKPLLLIASVVVVQSSSGLAYSQLELLSKPERHFQ